MDFMAVHSQMLLSAHTVNPTRTTQDVWARGLARRFEHGARGKPNAMCPVPMISLGTPAMGRTNTWK